MVKISDSPLIEGLIEGIRPSDEMGIIDWLEEHARFPHSDRNKRFSRETAPWLNPVLEEVANNDNRLIVCRGPVGSSKTTLFEALHQWIPSQEPGPTMTITQSDDDTQDWVETRLIKCLEACDPLRHIWPTEKVREKIKKDKHMWPHMFSLFGGANLKTLQSKSIRWGLGDEVWMWKSGMIREFEGRFHDRWNRRLLLVSQGATEDSEFSKKYDLTDKRVRHFECPKCKKVQPYDWANLKWTTYHLEDNPLNNYDYKKIFPTIHYCCSNKDCGKSWENSPIKRRELSNFGFYVPTSTDSIEGHVGFHWNALSVYWIDWATLVHEWLIAIIEKKKGNSEKFWQFQQKRLANDEELSNDTEYGDLLHYDYELSEYENGEPINDEYIRFMTNDKQINHYWTVIRAWRLDGSSRLIYEGRTLTEGDIKALQEQYKLPSNRVTVDAQYDTPSVYSMCSRNGWIALHGSKEKGFASYKGKSKFRKKEVKFVSAVEVANLGRGPDGRPRSCRYMFFAASRIKDILVNLRNNRGASWELPKTVSKEYAFQIDSEVKRKFINSKTKEEVFDYVKIRDNHLFDAEVHQVAIAYAVGLLGGDSIEAEEEESS